MDLASENEHLRAQIEGLKTALRAAVEESGSNSAKNDNCKSLQEDVEKVRGQLEEERALWKDEREQFELKVNLAIDDATEKATKEAKAKFDESTKKDKEKLREAIRKRAKAQSELASAKEDLEKSDAALKEALGNAETLSAQLAETSNAEKSARSELEGLYTRIKAMEAELSACKQLAGASEASAGELRSDLDILRGEHERVTAKVATLESELSQQEQIREDLAVEHKIANRRNIEMVKQLKTQLVKECKLKEAAEGIAAALRTKLEDAEGAARKWREANNEAAQAGTVPRSVVDALGKRLEGLLAENERVREQVRFLQSCVQSLTAELETKKAKVGELASKSEEGEATQEQLSMLKRDLKLMGKELLKATNAEVVEL